MAKAAVPKTPQNVTIPSRWQLAFVAALIGSVLISDGAMSWNMFRISRYVSGGTLAIQMSMWLYPVVYLLVALVFVQKRVRGVRPRFFWGVLVATIGTAVYQAVGAVLQVYLQETHYTIHGSSLWDSFGIDWVLMAVMFVLYVGTLVFISRKGKRA